MQKAVVVELDSIDSFTVRELSVLNKLSVEDQLHELIKREIEEILGMIEYKDILKH